MFKKVLMFGAVATASYLLFQLAKRLPVVGAYLAKVDA